MGGSGLSALIHLGAELENDFSDGLETISIGASADPDESAAMEICGKHLEYRIALRNDGGVWLSASLMDAPPAPDLLLRDRDSETGWRTVRGVVSALERHAVKSLERPIEAGEGEFGWVIA
jgi:hypothetical protein